MYFVKFCPHDLFVNTKADLGACLKVHDDEAKDLYEKAPYSYRKQQYEDEFIRFCQSMLGEVERKILKGKQRLALIGRAEAVIILFFPSHSLIKIYFQVCLYIKWNHIQLLVSNDIIYL